MNPEQIRNTAVLIWKAVALYAVMFTVLCVIGILTKQ